jgi:hypothetical protein
MMMNLFNAFNCRKIQPKEYNIFSRFFNNFLFLFIVAGEFFLQYLMITIGGKIFRTTPLPFTLFITSVAFGVGTLIVGVLLKTTPEAWLDKIKF